MLLYFEICFITMCGPVHNVSLHIIKHKEQILTLFSVLAQCGGAWGSVAVKALHY